MNIETPDKSLQPARASLQVHRKVAGCFMLQSPRR